MIISQSKLTPKNQTKEMLKKMETAEPFVFHLTGSRFIGHFNTGSDYDFFTELCSEVISWLTEQGFRRQSLPVDYNDVSCEAVYRYENIDIQITNPQYFSAKQVVNNFLKGNIYVFADILHSKETIRGLWTSLIKLVYDEVQEERIIKEPQEKTLKKSRRGTISPNGQTYELSIQLTHEERQEGFAVVDLNLSFDTIEDIYMEMRDKQNRP